MTARDFASRRIVQSPDRIGTYIGFRVPASAGTNLAMPAFTAPTAAAVAS